MPYYLKKRCLRHFPSLVQEKAHITIRSAQRYVVRYELEIDLHRNINHTETDLAWSHNHVKP